MHRRAAAAAGNAMHQRWRATLARVERARGDTERAETAVLAKERREGYRIPYAVGREQLDLPVVERRVAIARAVAASEGFRLGSPLIPGPPHPPMRVAA